MTRTFSAALLLIGVGISPLQAACPGGVSSYFKVAGEVTKHGYDEQVDTSRLLEHDEG